MRPFESYRFAGVPFVLRLAAEPAAAKVSAAVETVLKIGDDQPGLESRIRFDVLGRPVYRFQVLLPERFSARPARSRRTVAQRASNMPSHGGRDGRRELLTIYTAEGRQGETPVVMRGQLENGDLGIRDLGI